MCVHAPCMWDTKCVRNMVSENIQEKARRHLASKGLTEEQRTSICASCYKKMKDGELLQLRNGRTRGPRPTARRSGD